MLSGLSCMAAAYTLGTSWVVVTNVASLTNNIVSSGDNNRGMTYLSKSNLVFVPNKGGSTLGISAWDGTTGTFVGYAATNGIGGGTFLINQLGVADDGVMYGASLTTAIGAASGLRIYRWSDWTQPPVVAFDIIGSPVTNLVAGKRAGDMMIVKGSGTSTVILMPITSGTTPTATNLLFSTIDGTNFDATVTYAVLPTLSNGGGGPQFGVTFYTNGSFIMKPSGTSLYVVQYPANFGSLGSPLQLTVATTNTVGSPLSGNNVLMVYEPNSGLLAAYGTMVNSPPSVVPLNLYNISSLSGLSTSLAATNTAHFVANGNFAGWVAFGGLGNTNFIYTMDCNNRLVATAIGLQQAPTIISQPTGGTVFSPWTLAVNAGGATPLTYIWQASTNISNGAGTFTNILSAANTNFYVLANPPTSNYYRVIITNAAGSITSTPVVVSLITPVTNAVVSQLWRVAPGAAGYPFLSASDNNGRGLAYDTNSQRVVVASTTGGSGLYILDGGTGTNIGTLSMTGITWGGALGGVDQVGIADDGVVYAANLIASFGLHGNYNLFRWPAATNGATSSPAFAGDPGSGSGDRWGDTMAVRGAGTSTEILLGSRSGVNVALLTTADGLTFSSTLITITNAPAGFAANGITFGAGNTLWAKAYLGHLYQIAYDPLTQVGGVLLDYPNPAKIPSAQIGVAVDSVRSIMAGIDLADTANDLKLYQLTGTADPPVLFHQAFFATANVNGNANCAIAMKYPRAYGLDVNNGLVAVTYGVPATTLPNITTPPASLTVYTNNPALTFSVAASGSLPLYYQWQYSVTTNEAGFTNIVSASNSVYTLNYPALSAAGYYRVVVHNIAGYATSAPPALLTLLEPVISSVVTQLWTLPAGSRSYLDSSTYNTRGLAYDTNSSTVLVCDHNNIFVMNAGDGSDLFGLVTNGIYAGGDNGWLFDQIGVADDGSVYGANLYGAGLGGAGFSITRWDSVSVSANLNQAYGGVNGADPGSGSGDRWGDTMAVRGAGTGTEILIGSFAGNNVVLFTTADGQTFTPNLIAVTNVPAGFSGQGIAFGPGDTFWAKSPGYNLRQVAFDRSTWTAGPIQSFTAGTQFPSAFDGIGVDVTAGILGGVNFADTPDDLQLYLISGNTNPPALVNQTFFGSVNANSQLNAATTLKGGKGFSLDVNNGLVAVSYGVPAAPGVTITSVSNHPPTGVTITWNNCFEGHSYQVSFKNNLTNAAWTNLGLPVPATGATASFNDASTPVATRFYRVETQ